MTRVSFSEEDGVLRAVIAPMSRWWVLICPAVVMAAVTVFAAARAGWWFVPAVAVVFLSIVWQARCEETVVVGGDLIQIRRQVGRLGYLERCKPTQNSPVRYNEGFLSLWGWVECCDGRRIFKIGRGLDSPEGEELAERIRRHLTAQ